MGFRGRGRMVYAMRYGRSGLLRGAIAPMVALGFLAGASALYAETNNSAEDKAGLEIDDIVSKYSNYALDRDLTINHAGTEGPIIISPSGGGDNFPDLPPPTDPNGGYGDPGSGGYYPDPGYGGGMDPYGGGMYGRRNGAAERIAMEALYQTLNFYGVKHVLRKTNTRIEFAVVESKSGNFKNITRIDVAYAIKTFAQYLTANLCNDPSMENFYRVFSQVPAEQIGLRFKYDMAYALLGNSLPRQPNQIYKLGTRWQALQQVFNSAGHLSDLDRDQQSTLRSWISSLTDIVRMVTSLNRMLCFVDVRPNPKDEIKKRVVITKFLKLDAQMNERYKDLESVLGKRPADTGYSNSSMPDPGFGLGYGY